MKAMGQETGPEESGNKHKTVINSKRQKLGKEMGLRTRKLNPPHTHTQNHSKNSLVSGLVIQVESGTNDSLTIWRFRR